MNAPCSMHAGCALSKEANAFFFAKSSHLLVLHAHGAAIDDVGCGSRVCEQAPLSKDEPRYHCTWEPYVCLESACTSNPTASQGRAQVRDVAIVFTYSYLGGLSQKRVTHTQLDPPRFGVRSRCFVRPW